jgi:hypothetical protein
VASSQRSDRVGVVHDAHLYEEVASFRSSVHARSTRLTASFASLRSTVSADGPAELPSAAVGRHVISVVDLDHAGRVEPWRSSRYLCPA